MKMIEQMLARYPQEERDHAIREVMQEIALAGLQRAGFFDKAAFYGGTCLRIFYDLPRFSEDLDFSLLAPEAGFAVEERLLVQPYSFYVKCYALPDLYAGKMHALLFRRWKNRVKGRDWFDFEWYVQNRTPLNLSHLEQRARQSGDWQGGELSADDFKKMLAARIESLDVASAKNDVRTFVRSPEVLDLWSVNYFHDLARQVLWQM